MYEQTAYLALNNGLPEQPLITITSNILGFFRELISIDGIRTELFRRSRCLGDVKDVFHVPQETRLEGFFLQKSG